LGQSVGQLRAMLEKAPLLELLLAVAVACCAKEGLVPNLISVSSKPQLHSNKTVRDSTERTVCALRQKGIRWDNCWYPIRGPAACARLPWLLQPRHSA